MGQLIDHIRSYYEALNTGDPDKVAAHVADDAVHYYTRLGPHEGARTIGEHTKWAVDSIDGQGHIDNVIEDGEHARWAAASIVGQCHIDMVIEDGEQAVIEWSMPGRAPPRGEARLDRGP